MTSTCTDEILEDDMKQVTKILHMQAQNFSKKVPVVTQWAFIVPSYDFKDMNRLDPGFEVDGAVAWVVYEWIPRGKGRWVEAFSVDSDLEARRLCRDIIRKRTQEYFPSGE